MKFRTTLKLVAASLAAALLRLVPAEGRAVLLGRDWLSLHGEPLRQGQAVVGVLGQQ